MPYCKHRNGRYTMETDAGVIIASLAALIAIAIGWRAT